MAKRIKRNVTKSIKKNMTKRNTKKRKIRHKKRRQTIRRIYKGGVDAITSTNDLQKFLTDTIPMLNLGDKVIFNVTKKNGDFVKDTDDIVEVNNYIKSPGFNVYGMIESKDKLE